jgi:glutaconate CoA-transferase subunit A
MGVPFVPVRGLYGSDLMAGRPEFKAVDDPYAPGETVVTARALRPDLFLVHGAVADREGNLITVDEGRNDLLAAQASRRTLATVETLSDEPVTPVTRPGWTFIPAYYVTAVAISPKGAQPAGFRGLYPPDGDAMDCYVAAARSDETFKAWLEASIFTR